MAVAGCDGTDPSHLALRIIIAIVEWRIPFSVDQLRLGSRVDQGIDYRPVGIEHYSEMEWRLSQIISRVWIETKL
ncbi:MAG TPA: hypothetical protein VMN36_17835 [Verrucomicrobiales bacterium]|nr:hypothetical protein [Verrucomicrobiales bacterium]